MGCVETAMPSEPPVTCDPLRSAALLLARTSDLQERLSGLARAATDLVQGSVAAIHLLDEEDGALRPIAAYPIDPAGLPALEMAGLAPTDGMVLAVRDRREVVALAGGTLISALLATQPGSAVALHVPLVLARPRESPDVEGVLTLACPTTPPEGEALETLRALAALTAVAASQARLETALDERSDWFDRLAHTDALTGLTNRRTLDRVLELELARAARQGSDLCVAIFGVDDHDLIAEQHGAHAADDVLRRVAASLAETVRLVDTVARYGRAEFVVVAPGSSGLAMAERAAAAIGRIEPADGGAPVTVSVGVATFPGQGTTTEELLASAERALSVARARGGAVVAAD
jgi:diguanylate cyclase (GGDEF)-like protein